ncbi:hypothetical protein D3C81_1044450 [compost metagenome]
MDPMMEALEKLDGKNEHLVTKDDIKKNLERINVVTTVLKALAVGVEVKLEGRFIVMVEGLLYIKGIRYDTIKKESSNDYMGFNNISYEYLLTAAERVAKENPEWINRLKAETAIVVVLNNLDRGV